MITRKSIAFAITFILVLSSGLYFSSNKQIQKQEAVTLLAASTIPGSSKAEQVVFIPGPNTGDKGETTYTPLLSPVDYSSVKTFEQYYDIRHDLGNELYNIVTAETVEYENDLRELTDKIKDKKNSEILKLKAEYPKLYTKWMTANSTGEYIEKEKIEKLPELRDFTLKMMFHNENYHIVSQILLTRHNELIRKVNEEYTKKEEDAYRAYRSSERNSIAMDRLVK